MSNLIMRQQALTTILCALLSTFLIACGDKKNDMPSSDQKVGVKSDTIKDEVSSEEYSTNIKVVPVMTTEFSDSNTVHCTNVEYLWNAISKISNKDISKNPLVKEFNHSSLWKNSMDTSRLVLAYGNPEAVYKRIIQQYRTKYKINKNDLLPQGSSFWAYSHKIVRYKYDEPFDEQRLRFLGDEVSAFGFSSDLSSIYSKEYFKKQYDILYFDYDGEFVVRLNAANTKDEIILVMLNKRGTFLEMFNSAKRLIEKGRAKINSGSPIYQLNMEDELLIPVIKFKALHEYKELIGVKFSSDYGPIDSFSQAISFDFDRNGVVMESNVSVADSVGMPQKPKLLHFSRPFYLFIKEANAPYPYFNLWVSDASILERRKK